MDFYFGLYVHRAHPNKRPLKVFHKEEGRGYPGAGESFQVPPIISGYGLLVRLVHSQGPSEQKAIKNLWLKEAWAYPGASEIFSVPPPYYLSNG